MLPMLTNDRARAMRRRAGAATIAACGLVVVPTAAARAQHPAYALRVRIVPDSAWMDVSGRVTLPPADSARHEITLTLSAVFSNAQFSIVRPTRGGVLAASRVPAGDQTIWILRPVTPIAAHTPVQLAFTYSGDVRDARTFHVGADGSFVEIGWYPQDSTALPRDDRATGTLDIDVPPGLTAVGTGARRSTPDAERAGRFVFVTRQPRRLAFAVGRYRVSRRAGIPRIDVYLLRDRNSAKQFVEGTARALHALVAQFGPFPYERLSLVEVPSQPARAMGFGGRSVNGLVFVATDNLDRPFNLGFFSHELTHQWWADMLSPHGTAGEVFMLTEAMASYGSLRTVEALEGPAAAEHYRRVGYPGYSDTDLDYYLRFNATGLDTVPLTRLSGVKLAHDLSATKGFRVWDMLSREVGRARFDSALRAFAARHAFAPFTWTDFTAAITRAAHRPLGWFFSQWATERTGAPEWSVTWTQTRDSVHVDLAQRSPAYRLPIDIELIGGTRAQSVTHHVVIDQLTAQYSWAAPFAVHAVVADPHFLVMHWPPELADQIRGSAIADRGNWLDVLGHSDRALAFYQAALDSIPNPDRWGVRYQIEYGMSWLMLRAKRFAEAKHSMLDAIAIGDTSAAVQSLPCRAPGGSCAAPWGWYVVASAARAMGDSAQVCRAIANAIAADTGSKWGAANAMRSWSAGCR